MKPLSIVAAFALLATCLAGSDLRAVEVSPMIASLEPTGNSSRYRMRVKNTESVPVTIEFETYSMVVDDDGKRTLTEEKDDLLVFPPQSIIPPGREQIVQIRYIGKLNDALGKMFVVRVAQLPVELKSGPEASASVVMRIAFNVSTNIYVAPAKTVGKVEVRSVTRQPNGDVLASVENVGNGFALLRDATYAFTDATGRVIKVAPGNIGVGEVSALAAGRKRNLIIAAADLKASGPGALKLEVQLF